MAPILGILASSNYQRVTPDNGAMFPIAMVNVGSAGASFVEFTSIPDTYKHLQIRATWANSTGSDTWMRINNDTSNNYAAHFLNGNGSSASASAITGASALGAYVGYSGSTTSFTTAVLDVLDYTSTTKAKTTRSLTGYDANGSGQVYLFSSLWFATPAKITSLKITPASGTINQYSQFALYGIK